MDVWNARTPIIAIGIVGSMILSFMWVILVRLFVGCIVWTTIVLVLMALFFFGVWSYLNSGIFDTSALTNAMAKSIANLDLLISFANLTDSGISDAFNFTSDDSSFALNLGVFELNVDTTQVYTISAVTCTVLFVAVLVGVIIFCKKIRIAIAIIKEASKAIQQMPCLPFLPFVTGFFTLAFFALFIWMAFFIYSLEYITVGTILSDFQNVMTTTINVNCTQVYNEAQIAELQNNITEIQRLKALGTNMSVTESAPEFAGIEISALIAQGQKLLLQDAPDYAIQRVCSGLEQLEQFASYELDTAMLFFHLFAWLWTNQIIAAINLCIIAGAVADWYFTRPSGDPSRKGGDGNSFRYPILRSISRTFRFHLGSLIFGSLIVALVQLIRYIMMWLDEKTKDWQNKNKCFQIMFKVIHCLLLCFEKCIKYITENAYIMIAMRGYSFCDSCCRGLKLLFENMVQFMLVACFSRVIMVLGKIAIIAIGVTSLYFWLHYDPFFSLGDCDNSIFGCDSDLQKVYGGAITNKFFPVLVGAFCSYLCSRAFLFVYHTTIQTILLCFCEDCRVHQMHESTPLAQQLHKEAYMSKNLRRIMLPSKEFKTMKEPMTLEEVMALDPDNNKDPNHTMDRLLDPQEIVYLTKKILDNSDEGLHGDLDVDKLKDNKALLKTAGGQPLLDAYKKVRDKKRKGIKYVDVVTMIHEHLGEQGLLKKWKRPLTQEEIDNHFESSGLVTPKAVKSVQHGRFDSNFSKEKSFEMLTFQSIGEIGGGDAKRRSNLHGPRETPKHKS